MKNKKKVKKSRTVKKIVKKKQTVKKRETKIKKKPLVKKKNINKRQTVKKSKTVKKIVRKRQPVKKKERVSTGVVGLNKLISGGFIKSSVNLVEGGSGTGKSIFAMQYLFDGLKNKESVLYITFEEKKDNFYQNMKDFGWDLEKEEKSNKFFFLEYSPEKIKMMLDEGGGSIESMVLKHKITRIVIDSITSFTLLFDTELEKRGAALGLFDVVRKWGCTTLLIVQHDPLKEEKEDISLLEYEVDGIVLLYFKKKKNQRERSVEVIKMRGTYHSTEVHVFEIKKGIEVRGHRSSAQTSPNKKKTSKKTKKTTHKKKSIKKKKVRKK
jgi:KaiC/GvpD/RAD55 family RecA-like ATPase